MDMTSTDQTKLAGIVLETGTHKDPAEGLCLLEAVAYIRGLPHTDRPPCVSPVLGETGRKLNDVLPDDIRQQLIPLITVLPGTANDGHDKTRSHMALDWLVRTWLPIWLDLSPGCRGTAAEVRGLARIVDLASAKRAGPVVRAAHAQVDAAWAAAWDAAAWDAAAWAAAWDAAAWDAAAWDAAAWAAAVWAAAWDAAWDAAAWAALAPTITQLQLSAVALYYRMALVGRELKIQVQTTAPDIG